MAELLNHQHCRVCEQAIPLGATTCPEHAKELEAIQRRKKRTVLLFYVASAVLALILLRQLLAPVL